jgi:hypothetical protein
MHMHMHKMNADQAANMKKILKYFDQSIHIAGGI